MEETQIPPNLEKDESVVEEDKPPDSLPRPARPWRVAVIANVKGESTPAAEAEDASAEFDSKDTIQAIQSAIETDGHSTIFLQADSNLPIRLNQVCPDICFNIAEGLGGDAREAQAPAVMEILHVPYTASRVLTNALSLDKTMTKRIWRDVGLPTAAFQEFVSGDEPISADLNYPLFVKPAREGTGMGMDSGSIAHSEDQLRQRVRWTVKTYQQPALVEEYLCGREFTVGVIGRPGAIRYSRMPQRYETDGFIRLPALEVESSQSATPGVYGHYAKTLHPGEEGVPQFLCPADITPRLARKLQDLAIRAHTAIGALDVSRVDIRLDARGEPKLIEINTLPGLSPGFSDLCVICEAAGIAYTDLILEILYLGASRFGLLMESPSQPVDLPTPAYIRTMSTQKI